LIAAVAKLLYELGCNLEDSSMTRLQGEFAILLVFTAPDKQNLSLLSKKLKPLEKSGLTVHLKSLAPREYRTPAAKEECLVTLYGADQPGLVYHATRALSLQKVNVTDLTTHRTQTSGTSGYILYMEGEIPEGEIPQKLSREKLQRALQKELRKTGVTVSVKPLSSSPL
jgi:glycine cleavage system transcriptional repressor